MAIYDAIKNLNKQFEYVPRVENQARLEKFEKFAVVGMGGSHLAADLIRALDPYIDLIVHQDYGLPPALTQKNEDRLMIASSYSGNTEEVIDAYKEAKEKNIPLAAVSIGGELLEMAQKDGVPFVQIPDTGTQPRSAVGYMFRALLKLMDREDDLKESGKLANEFLPSAHEDQGRGLSEKIKGHMPIIYSSTRNGAIAQNWRVRFNETGKVPAFYNVFPELNHNEMTGFDLTGSTRGLSEKFYFIFLSDVKDHPKIKKRMEITAKLYGDRGLPVAVVELKGESVFHKIFNSIALADWTAYYLGKDYGVETEQVPMVEEFKKLIG